MAGSQFGRLKWRHGHAGHQFVAAHDYRAGGLRQIFCAGRPVHRWPGSLDLFSHLETCPAGGHARRTGGDVEFDVFRHRLLGSGFAANCAGHGLFCAGADRRQHEGNSLAHPLGAAGFGRPMRGPQCHGGGGHWRAVQPVHRGVCVFQILRGGCRKCFHQSGLRGRSRGHRGRVRRIYRISDRGFTCHHPDSRRCRNRSRFRDQGCKLGPGHAMEPAQGRDARTARPRPVRLQVGYAKQHDVAVFGRVSRRRLLGRRRTQSRVGPVF